MLKTVLFDLDDTLLDWSGYQSNWKEIERKHLDNILNHLHSEGHAFEDASIYIDEYHNRTSAAWLDAKTSLRAPHMGKLLIETAAALGVPETLLDLQRFQEIYQWGIVDGTCIFPEVPAVLKTLQENNIKVGIVTNAHQPMSMRDLEIQIHGLYDFFPDCRISAADVGYLKPHRAIFEAALSLCGSTPEETVFVGDDTEADIVGAQQLGMQAVMRTSHRPQPRLGSEIFPNAVIDSLDQLLGVLDGWHPDWRHA